MARRNYALELQAAAFLPFLLVVVDSGVIGVVLKNAYKGEVSPGLLNLVVAIVTASTSAANIIGFAWVRLSLGVDKVRFVNALQLAMIALVALIAAAPRTGVGLWMIVMAVLSARIVWSGFVTVRSTVWGCNYAPGVRARVTGRLAMVQTGTLAVLGLGLGWAMDRDESAYRYFFPVGCALALVGVLAWSRIRVRGHAALRRAELARDDGEAPSFNPLGVYRVLRADRHYARFMRCLTLLGLGNLMLAPITLIACRDIFHMGYLGGILVSNSLPLFMMPLTIPLWARLLDRVHVIRFRSVHAWVFIAASALTVLAIAFRSLPLMYVSAIFSGIGFGGGVLAWNLGHLDFAPRGRETEYMGVHLTLNGMRGLAAPFLGVGIYEATTNANPDLAWVAFAACFALCLAGGVGFVRLAMATPRSEAHAPRPAEAAPPAKSVGE